MKSTFLPSLSAVFSSLLHTYLCLLAAPFLCSLSSSYPFLSLLPSPFIVTLVVQWTEVTRLEKNATLVFPESVRVSTRHTEHYFSMFLNINDTFKLMEQLATIAMRQLLDNEGFAADRTLPKACKTLKNVSALKRYEVSRFKRDELGISFFF